MRPGECLPSVEVRLVDEGLGVVVGGVALIEQPEVGAALLFIH